MNNLKVLGLYSYKIRDVRIIDGDSIEATLDRGMGDSSRKVIRLFGIDAPESRTRDLEEKKKGIASRMWLYDRISAAVSGKHDIVIQSHKKGSGKYGRLLGTIIIQDVDVNIEMVELGLAKVYDGGKR